MNVTITPKVINKIIKNKHSINPNDLKKIPAQINNPVAISKSRTVENGYIVFTELTENVAGKGKPVIAAMHIKTSDNGIEVMNIASAYGRNKGQMESDLGKAVYWNTKKGSQLANAFGLQLPPELRSLENLSNANIKTENDLTQDDDVKFSLAYHGSPHQFDRFDYSHMGSGEGNQKVLILQTNGRVNDLYLTA